jgi:hypothetical protein
MPFERGFLPALPKKRQPGAGMGYLLSRTGNFLSKGLPKKLLTFFGILLST